MADVSAGRFLAVRLRPGQELKASLLELSAAFSACAVVTCVGSLRQASLRLANADRHRPDEVRHFDELLEITSLVGTLGQGKGHLHVSLADKDGNCFGGHLLSGQIFTTAEIVLLELPDLNFRRDYDEATGFAELQVSRSKL
ncbi:unnamed protein product [Effrenium voratum]|uniref:PPC domain-containing protein n=1 Tax=Effrenium voratum TaxID=2562239 RepID=A0AA36HMP4_9DINO|nr:unnamed protein product [Effrenium voratum]CAJ1428158.1 unnamed protein product [Effrenium voratum]